MSSKKELLQSKMSLNLAEYLTAFIEDNVNKMDIAEAKIVELKETALIFEIELNTTIHYNTDKINKVFKF